MSVNNDNEYQSGMDNLLRSAAYAMNCPVAVYYEEDDGVLHAVACFGTLEAASYEPDTSLWNAESKRPIIINDVAVDRRLPISEAILLPHIDTTSSATLRFAALMPISGNDDSQRGMLLIGDDQAHAGLSDAQIHVLYTHASQLHRWKNWQSDISRREASDTADGANSERLRLLESVVVTANDAVLITEAEPIDLPGPRIVYCNEAFTRTTGYSQEEVLGQTPRILHSEDTDRSALDRLKNSLRRWRPIEVELLNKRKNGEQFWVELSIVPVADERGWFTHWISVQRDVSERKRAEAIENKARLAEAEKAALEAKLVERERSQEMLTYAAFHDDLTKLYNRAHVMERLRETLTRKSPIATAILFIDMDRFKLVNDSLGHRAGDLLLMETARRLEKCIRSDDTLARVGGDEFVILVDNIEDVSTAAGLAERILVALRQPIRLAGQSIFASCSIGIVEIDARYTDPEAPLRDADIAMYTAKAKGTDQYSLFTESMRAKAVATLSLQNDLKQAIAGQEFFLEYQPIYHPATRAIEGVEALVRWQHPQRGRVPPEEFIAIAEDIGAIRDIGRWVLTEACRQTQHWIETYPGLALNLNVNVSAHELKHDAFPSDLESTLRETGFVASRLQLEVTENVFLSEADHSVEVLKSVRALGVRVALDDFGTGYSSLSYIDRYPLDAIKIDRSFVQKMLASKPTLAIVDCVLRLGQMLDIDIIAEGVENEAQLATLVSMNCPLVQGYLLGRPMSDVAFEELLNAAASLQPLERNSGAFGQ